MKIFICLLLFVSLALLVFHWKPDTGEALSPPLSMAMPEQVYPGMILPLTPARLGALIRPGMELSEVIALFGPPVSKLPYHGGGERLSYLYPPEQCVEGMGGFTIVTNGDKVSRWDMILVDFPPNLGRGE